MPLIIFALSMNTGAISISSSLSVINRRSHRLWIPSTDKTAKFSSILNKKMTDFCCFSTSNYSASAGNVATDSDTSPSSVAVQPKPKPWLIVGLGNPGKKYSGTRHNDGSLCHIVYLRSFTSTTKLSYSRPGSFGQYSSWFQHRQVNSSTSFAGYRSDSMMYYVGFELVDTIAEAEGISMTSVSFKSLCGKGYIGSVPVILSKPQTYMNLSGESVGPMVSYYKIPLKQVLLVYDDMDLPFAKLRLLPKGGHGGHNGMRSVIDHLKGNRDFPRLRIGIGRPPGRMDPVNFVICSFSRQEREELDFTFQNGLEAVRIMLLEGFNKSATFVNSAKQLERPC